MLNAIMILTKKTPSGSCRNNMDKQSFWDSVSYYEYLTHAMNGPKDSIPDYYWEEAKEAFIEVCKKLKPDIIICMGYETYEHLPNYGEIHESFKTRGKNETLEVWKYDKKIKAKEIKDPLYVCRIRHPSAPEFVNKNWFALFRRFLESLE